MTAKIEPWMKLAAEHIEDAYTVAIQQQVVGTEPAVVEVAYIIAAHAPTNEEWFERGGKTAFRAANKSGCACGIDENDNVLEVCAVHADWCKSYAPKQEWEAKEKALLTYAHELDDAGYSGEMIRRILNEGVKP